MAKAEANLTEGVLTARPPPCFRSQLQSGCLADELGDPRVVALYAATTPQELRVPSAFFCAGGWVADKPYYIGNFDPKKQWKCKAKGELMLHFDGDDQATKVRVRSLLDYNFTIVALTQLFSDSDGDVDSDEEEEQQGPGQKSGGDSSKKK